MTIKKIAVLPGDGIVPEVMREALKVLDVIQELESHGLRAMLINAVVTATRRSEELSKILNNL